MPILWDIGLCVVSGFFLSSLKPLFKNTIATKLKNRRLYLIGLLFTLFVNLLISVWCWIEVDPNWLVLYWFDPQIIASAVWVIYALFPLYYTIAYWINLRLIRNDKSRYSLLIVASGWSIFTILVYPDFITLFKGNDVATLSVDYPAQLIFFLTSYPPKNALWILPFNYGFFFFVFYILVTGMIFLIEYMAIQIARKDFYKIPSETPSRLLLFLTNIFMDLSNKLIIRKSKKDYRFRQFVKNFEAKIQFSTKDDYIYKFLVFDGKGGITYAKGKLDNPDATLMYRSVRDLFIVLKNFGDVYEAMLENRFELFGNLNILFKYQFLTNCFNPKAKKMPGLKQKILADLPAK